MTSNDIAWLTQDAYDELRSELDQLQSQGRSEIAKRIEEARGEGDLSENGGYHAAKEEQGKQEARIRQIQDLLQRAQVGEPPAANGRVQPGMVVTIRFVGDEEPEVFLLGSREIGHLDSVEHTVYSPNSPLGRAVHEAEVGSTVSYLTPSGASVQVEVLDAEPFTG